jgi:hypothetical protein
LNGTPRQIVEGLEVATGLGVNGSLSAGVHVGAIDSLEREGKEDAENDDRGHG